ncbi:phosphopantothenoylcysteine decarboxylase/phosphopantothenate--cysteine ligase [Desulfobaculum xiamenense]|uniref:Coenzyme A biosynthesis bifunctional protein CoaBC n=1 Tax=Desulfobaculum xiamenense TaxID=995050 RepID=A0A846QLB6_9BACT|nr:bifunctional phosphopantothenoylcysteine decarboxylase/phosphopantothenate--cysteine ligase CoaBC [Desulfobaculum xiamenense]NJB67977.1 phosphopantothenoylcysteine decarboxylase/phosphopantothenate--cysteine ligase [Desulfobaculum xiamenense]
MYPHLAFSGLRGRRVHVGVCGSVAAFKTLELIRDLGRCGVHVGATLTEGAQRFVTPLSFEALGAVPVYGGVHDVASGTFGHLEPGQDAHAFAVAPATANMLAKLACGLADDMLSCQALAFPGPIVIAPAMNPRMWNAAATRENWQKLKDRGNICIEPGCGEMACGDEGRGRFPAIETIHLEILRALSPQDMRGRKVLVTLGPTREYFDAVRFWSNPSTGTMGASIAVAAWLRGAEVTAVCGPTSLWLPEGIRRIDVTTAREMFEAATAAWPDCDTGCLTAAVADFRPVPFGTGKFKKEGSTGLEVRFENNPDILFSLGQNKREGQRLIGFAAEAADLEANAQGKLRRKNLDMIIGNDVTKAGSGFGTTTNAVVVHDATGRTECWDTMPKPDVAWRIWDWMLAL